MTNFFDKLLNPKAWFDSQLISRAWFDDFALLNNAPQMNVVTAGKKFTLKVQPFNYKLTIAKNNFTAKAQLQHYKAAA